MITIKKATLAYVPIVLTFVFTLCTLLPSQASADPLGNITEYTAPLSNTHPVSITEGSDGNIWFAVEPTRKIIKMSKTGAFLAEYSIPGPVNTWYLQSLTKGWDGRIWFTDLTSYGEV